MLSLECRKMLQQWEIAAGHPANAAHFWYFSSRVARAIWDCKAKTYITGSDAYRACIPLTSFRDSSTYNWSLPITHIIKLEPDYEGWQDACLTGAGGFSYSLQFWWIVKWPHHIALRMIWYLGKGNKSLITINMLEYVAIIISLMAAIVSWELLPIHKCPVACFIGLLFYGPTIPPPRLGHVELLVSSVHRARLLLVSLPTS